MKVDSFALFLSNTPKTTKTKTKKKPTELLTMLILFLCNIKFMTESIKSIDVINISLIIIYFTSITQKLVILNKFKKKFVYD